jgi:putative membrane protein
MRITLRRNIHVLALSVLLLLSAPLVRGQVASNMLSNSDESFIKQTYQEVVASERLAILAANRGNAGAVRSLGAGAVGTLRNIREKLHYFARKKGVTLSDDLTAQNQYAIDTLTNASGEDFDQTYLKLILEYLPKILGEFKTVAGATHDPDLKAVTTRAIPTIQARIRAAQTAKERL